MFPPPQPPKKERIASRCSHRWPDPTRLAEKLAELLSSGRENEDVSEEVRALTLGAPIGDPKEIGPIGGGCLRLSVFWCTTECIRRSLERKIGLPGDAFMFVDERVLWVDSKGNRQIPNPYVSAYPGGFPSQDKKRTRIQ